MFTLQPLPYAFDALEPYISSRTLRLHYEKHHQGYLDKLNALFENKNNSDTKIEDVIISSYKTNKAVFNNAAQVWNHTFYWHSMKPQGGNIPTCSLLKQIEKDFGSFQKFQELFIHTGMNQFGSGWVWLVWSSDQNKLELISTSNAELPLILNKEAILTSDVWEHTYYVDYQNRRLDYLQCFLEKLANWEFAQCNFEKIHQSLI